VLLETLNDIAASEFLGVKTLTVAIYTTWVTRSDLPGAAQIALAMLTVVMLVLAIERYGRRRQGYAVSLRPRPLAPQRLRGRHAAFAALASSRRPRIWRSKPGNGCKARASRRSCGAALGIPCGLRR
jgi:iron(III) transport system permease protein